MIEGLLRKDPAERLPADRAERDLRLVAAGGTPSAAGDPGTAGGAYAPFPPTAATRAEPFRHGSAGATGPTAPQPWATGPDGAPGRSPSPAEPDRGRRAGVLLVAGVAVLALAVAGLTYGLLHRNDGREGDSGDVTNSASEAVSSPAPQRQASESAAASPSQSPSPSGSPSSAAPEQTVSVVVAGSHTDYTGVCPPQDSDAPAFTATITVGRLPATVSYRWVTKDGELSGQTWKTLDFPSGGAKSKQDKVIVSTYAGSGTYRNSIAVEVRDPVKATSQPVPFSVTCETETPSGGASPPPLRPSEPGAGGQAALLRTGR